MFRHAQNRLELACRPLDPEFAWLAHRCSVRSVRERHLGGWVLCGQPYGATAHVMNERLDDGAIIARQIYPIPQVNNELEVVLSLVYMLGDIALQAIRAMEEDLPTIPNHGGIYYHAMHPALEEISMAIMKGKAIMKS